jgi:hypothetical protein
MATTPWAAPPLAVSGNTESSAAYNILVDDVLLVGTPPGCCLQNNASGSISNGVATSITFSTALRDTDGFFNVGTHPTRATVPANLAGWYDVESILQFASSSTGVRALFLYINGSQYCQLDNTNALSAGTTVVTGSTTVQLNAGDYVEVWAYQTSGAPLNVIGTPPNSAAIMNVWWRSN